MNLAAGPGFADPRRVCWMQLHSWDGRYLGLFMRLDDVEAWTAGRLDTPYLLNVYRGGRIFTRWAVMTGRTGGFRIFKFAGVIDGEES